MKCYIYKKVITVSILFLLAAAMHATAIGSFLDLKKEYKPIGASVSIGAGIPLYFQKFNVENDLFEGGIHSPSLDINVQARYEIYGTKFAVVAAGDYGWTGSSAGDFWGSDKFTGMKGTNWSVLAGFGYNFQTHNKSWQFIPSGVINFCNTELSGSYKVKSSNSFIIQNDYCYKAWSLDLGADLYFFRKISDFLGVSFTVTPLATLISNGSLEINDKLSEKINSIEVKPGFGSFMVDSKINFVVKF